MELLLFLTALFTGLTGAFSGERAAAGQLRAGTVFVRAAEAGEAAVQAVRAAPMGSVRPGSASVTAPQFHVAIAPLLPVRLTFERRLE